MSDHKTDWSGVALGLGLACLGAFQLFKLPPVLPIMLESYGYDRSLAGGFVSIYAAAGLLLSLPFGRWITRRGATQPVLWALATISLGNLLGLVAPALGEVMLAARALEGIGFTVLAIAGPVLANRNASPRHRPLVIGMTAGWIPVGQLTAGGLAPLMVAGPGWQGLWVAGLAINGAMALWLLRRRARGGSETQPTQTQGQSDATLSLGLIALLAVGGSIFLFWSGQYFAAMTWLPQYFVEAQGLALTWAQLGTLLPVIVLLGFNLVTGMLIGRGWSIGALLAAALVSQALLWLCLPLVEEAGLAIGLVALVAYGIGAGISPTCLFAIPNALVGIGATQARAFGIIMTGRNLGVLLGPVVLAEAYKAAGSWSVAAPVFGTATSAAVLLAVILWLGLRRNAAATQGTKR